MLSAINTPPSAVSDLGLTGSLTPEEQAIRRKKLMAAAGNDPMAKFGSAAAALLGSGPTASGTQSSGARY